MIRNKLLRALLFGVFMLASIPAISQSVPEIEDAIDEVAMAVEDELHYDHPETKKEALVLGLQITVVGTGAVFIGLALIYVGLLSLGKMTNRAKRAASKDGVESTETIPDVSAEVAHAIALALFLDLRTFDEAHAEEITIRKVSRPYSPWWHSGKTQMISDKLNIYKH